MLETIRFILSCLCIAAGLFFEITAVLGIYKFKYVLSRMHAAALGDTMGIFMMMLGLAIANGANLMSLKLLILVVLFWISSPVSSHLIGRLELVTNEDLKREVSIWKS